VIDIVDASLAILSFNPAPSAAVEEIAGGGQVADMLGVLPGFGVPDLARLGRGTADAWRR